MLGNRFGVIETNRTFQAKCRRRDQMNGEPVQSYNAELKKPVTLTVEYLLDRSMTRVKYRTLLKLTVDTLGVNQEQIGKTGRQTEGEIYKVLLKSAH